MVLVLLIFLWMARGYKYASVVADATTAAVDSQHAIDDDSTPVSIREGIAMRQHE
jgi:hypothetical protein